MTNLESTAMVKFLRFCLRLNMVIGCCMLGYPFLILIFGESTMLPKTHLSSIMPTYSVYLKIFAVIVATLMGIYIGGRMTKKADLRDIIKKYEINFFSLQEILAKEPFDLKDAELLISWISDNKNSLLASSKDIIKADYILDVILENMVLEDLMTIQKKEICACFLDMGIFIDDIIFRMSNIYDVCANSKQFTVTLKGIKITSITTRVDVESKNPSCSKSYLNTLIKVDPLRKNVDPNLTQNNVDIFKEALRRYENSIWKTSRFIKKEQIAFSIFIHRLNEQELILRKSNESVDLHRNALKISESWKIYDELLKQEERKGQRKFLEMMKVNDTRYRSNYTYIGQANSPYCIKVIDSEKTISFHKWPDPDD
ncbi:hypothetical protein FL877_13250 [Listeria monocytogenes]|nr:hypothetical protein [Listeria monocytogenes]